MKYGIICAMQEEIELLRADLTETAVTHIAGRDFCAGKLYGRDVVLVMSRIGKVASASTATTLIDLSLIHILKICAFFRTSCMALSC